MTLEMTTDQEDHIVIKTAGADLLVSVRHSMATSASPVRLTKKEASKLWAALGKALRDPQA